MDDLISRKEVLDVIQGELNLNCGYDADIALLSVKKAVSELPTAYDVDAVEKKLQEKSYRNSGYHKIVKLVDALDIVRNAGKESETMIDEKVLIERLEVLKKDKYVFAPTMCYAFEKVEEIVNDLASEHNNGWISVEDALPERNKPVLCWAKSTARGGDCCFVGSCGNGLWFLQSAIGTLSFPTQYVVVEWCEIPVHIERGNET